MSEREVKIVVRETQRGTVYIYSWKFWGGRKTKKMASNRKEQLSLISSGQIQFIPSFNWVNKVILLLPQCKIINHQKIRESKIYKQKWEFF